MSAAAPAGSRRGLVGLFAADGISTLGTRMSALAVPWFVLVNTGSGTAAGVAAFAELVPYVIAQALGGPAIDRLGAWRTRIVADLVAAVGVAVVPVLWAAGSLPFGGLCAVLAVVGVARGFGDTAGYVLLPGLVDRAGTPMARATGLHDGVRRVAQLTGAPVAGALIAVTSAPAVLIVDAVSFAVAALVVVTTVPRAAQPERTPRTTSTTPAGSPLRTYLAELTEGFAFLRADRLLLGIAVMVTVTNMVDQAWGSVLSPVWARDVAGSPVALGLIALAFGLSAVAGNALAAWLGPRLPQRLAYGVGFLLCGAPRFAALALATTISPVLVVVAVCGVGAGVLNPILGAVEFARVPRPLQARVLGSMNAVAWVGMPFGGLLAGLGVDHVGLVPTLWIAGGVYLATTLAPFVFPVWKELDTPSAPSAPSVAPEPARVPANSGGVGSTSSG